MYAHILCLVPLYADSILADGAFLLQGEIRLTSLLTWGSDDPHVLTHAAPLPDAPKPPIKVQV